MPDTNYPEALTEALERSEAYRQELDETNKGIIALTMELEKKNEEMNNMNQQVWQVAKMASIGELSASVAHELNNPLTIISLRLEGLMERISINDPSFKPLTIIAQEVERMAHLVKSLLDFSRIHTIEFSTVNICEEIERSLELVSYHLRKKNIKIDRDLGMETPYIHADKQQLRQVFLNLFTNASDAMKDGGVLTISLRRSAPDGKYIVVEVRDTGCGIAPENLAKVMDPFFSTKREGKGTGLGLSICRRIIHGHNGSMDICSELNKGTNVSIQLPVTNGKGNTMLEPDSCREEGVK
ncbi:MAG: sensor histidine kinase [Negativicutes bacterium]